MGEKEQGAARESDFDFASKHDAAAGMTAGREGGITHEDDWEAPVSRATGDPGGDGSPRSAINNSHSNIKGLRQASGGGDDDTDGDGLPGDERLNGLPPGEPVIGKMGAGPVRLDPTPARVSEGGGSDIAIGDPGVNGR